MHENLRNRENESGRESVRSKERVEEGERKVLREKYRVRTREEREKRERFIEKFREKKIWKPIRGERVNVSKNEMGRKIMGKMEGEEDPSTEKNHGSEWDQ